MLFLCRMMDYLVVIQCSSGETDVQKAVLGQINNLIQSIPEIGIELVVHSRGVSFIEKGTHWHKQLQDLHNKNVRILVCQHTLNAAQLEKDQLLPFVSIIPSAVAHLVRRQAEGWQYLKAGF